MTPSMIPKELKTEETKLLKYLKLLKKFLSKEFLMFALLLVIAIPLSITIEFTINKIGASEVLAALNKLFKSNSDFASCYLISFFGLYFTRSVSASIKNIFKPKSS